MLFIPVAQVSSQLDGSTVILQFVKEIGLVATVLILSFVGLWRVVIPAIVKRWEDANKERIQRDEVARIQLEESRQFLVKELNRLQEDNRVDKNALLQAYIANTVASTKLATTIEQNNDLLVALTNEITTVKTDVNQLFRMLGAEKRLIKE